jgi:hypothetical protein
MSSFIVRVVGWWMNERYPLHDFPSDPPRADPTGTVSPCCGEFQGNQGRGNWEPVS